MTTFSQLVDLMATELMRPDLKQVQIAQYLNQAIREIHFDPQSNNAIQYRENFTETQLTASVETGFTWEYPNPDRFQAIQVVKYDNVWDRDSQMYPPEMIPSRALAGLKCFYYRAGGVFAFAGYGGTNAKISIGYYEFPKRLKYYAVADRPASYDPEDGWTYGAGIVTDEDKLEARLKVSNWLLLRWDTVLEEALRAKVYKRVSDTERARTSYSMYLTLRRGLVTAESDMTANFQ